jgi:maltose/maltodextrin transport system substrate-binding protein
MGGGSAINSLGGHQMKTTTKILALAAVILTGSTSLTSALEKDKILIWIGANRDEAALSAITQRFTEDLGIPVTVEVVDPDLPQKYQQAAATGDGPDIVMWAHDRFGEWAQGGLISPVDPSPEIVASALETAWDAVMFGGQTWGYPVAVEAVGLVYNKDLVPTPPTSFEEIASMEVPEGKTAIMWDYNNTYFTFPLMMANGGYAFVKKDGVYDGTDTGVNNEGAVEGASMLKRLIDEGVMPKGVDYGVMDAAMAQGDVAMVINGPWSWAAYEQAGINVGVGPLPSVAGQPSKPFIGVIALAINAASPNKDLAEELIENYILTDEGVAAWNANGALGAVANINAGAEANENVQATLANAAIGVPMPSNPEMGKFWDAMGPALSNITSGAASVEDALNEAANRILAQ